MAGAEGFEPPKCQDQNLVPYHLATPQLNFLWYFMGIFFWFSRDFLIFYLAAYSSLSSNEPAALREPSFSILVYSPTTISSMCFLISALRGWAMSLKEPSFLRREGIDTNKPFSPSITLRSRTMNALSNTMVAYAFNRVPSFAG